MNPRLVELEGRKWMSGSTSVLVAPMRIPSRQSLSPPCDLLLVGGAGLGHLQRMSRATVAGHGSKEVRVDSKSSSSGRHRTYSPRARDIKRDWWVVDADGMTLGRMASEVARVLRGKHKTIVSPHMDTGDHVIIINAAKVVLTGAKQKEKLVYRHTGYPGGIKSCTYGDLLTRRPAETVRKSIEGMLPKNSLGRHMAEKLQVYSGPDHRHHAQRPKLLPIPEAYPKERSRPQLESETIHESHDESCENSPCAGLSIRALPVNTELMTVVEITSGAQGRRLESAAQGLLNVFSTDGADTITWSTDHSAIECFRRLISLEPPNGESEAAICGAYDGDEWSTTRTNTTSDALLATLATFLDTGSRSSSPLILLERADAVWIWTSDSRLQNGTGIRTFGCEVARPRTETLLDVFDATSNNEAREFRSVLAATLKHA